MNTPLLIKKTKAFLELDAVGAKGDNSLSTDARELIILLVNRIAEMAEPTPACRRNAVTTICREAGLSPERADALLNAIIAELVS